MPWRGLSFLEHPLWPIEISRAERLEFRNAWLRLKKMCDGLGSIFILLILVSLPSIGLFGQQLASRYIRTWPFDEYLGDELLWWSGIGCLLSIGLGMLLLWAEARAMQYYASLRPLQARLATLPWELRAAILFPSLDFGSQEELLAHIRHTQGKYSGDENWQFEDEQDRSDNEASAEEVNAPAYDPLADDGISFLGGMRIDEYPLKDRHFQANLPYPAGVIWSFLAGLIGCVLMLMARFPEGGINDYGSTPTGFGLVLAACGIAGAIAVLQGAHHTGRHIVFLGNGGTWALIGLGLIVIAICLFSDFQATGFQVWLFVLGLKIVFWGGTVLAALIFGRRSAPDDDE